MKAGWEYRTLGDVCDVIGGGTPAKDNDLFYLNGSIPWATVRDMKSDVIADTEFKITTEAVKSSSTNIILKGNIVIATRVGLGKVCLLAQDTAINQDLKGIVPKNPSKLMVGYLFQWFKNNAQVILDEGTGATVQGVKLPFIKSLIIPIPTLPEQQRIVGILDEAFEGIATAKANAEKNHQNARALFESQLQSVFSQQGEGWILRRLDDVCDLITCGVAAKPDYVDVGIPFLSAKNVKRGKIVWSGYNCITQKTHDELTKNNKPLMGDILYTRVGSFGEAAVIEEEIEFSVFVSLTLIKPQKNILNNYFLKYYLNSSSVKELAKRSISSSGVGNLNVGTVRDFPINIPSLATQIKIVESLDELSNETQHLESIYQQKLAALDALKKSLLDQAFSGQL